MLGAIAVALLLAAPAPGAERPEFEPGTVLVRFEEGARAGLDRHGLRVVRRVPRLGIEVLATAGDPAAVARALERDPAVVYAEPNHRRRMAAPPDDPLYRKGSLGYLDTLRLPAAWDISRAGPAQRVAVLDTGVDATHPDLAGRVLPGRDFVNGDGTADDDEGHGTSVAGVAVARANDGAGTVGVSWDGSVVPVKVLDSGGEGYDDDIAAGIAWAADEGVDAINLSLGGPGASEVLEDAVAYAREQGVLVVAAAGNESSSEPHYPAATPGVLAVAASDWAGNATWFTNHGDWVDITAPGHDMFAPTAGGVRTRNDGTSFSAPVVAGVALLLAAEHPRWTGDQIAERLTGTALDVGPAGRDPFHGAGLVDPVAALGGAADARHRPAAARRQRHAAARHAADRRSPRARRDLGAGRRGLVLDRHHAADGVLVHALSRRRESRRPRRGVRRGDRHLRARPPAARAHRRQRQRDAGERGRLAACGGPLLRARHELQPVAQRRRLRARPVRGQPRVPQERFEPTAVHRIDDIAAEQGADQARSVALGDVTGDGLIDTVLTADEWDEGNDDKLFVFAGNAAGTLDSPVMLPAPGTSQELGLALADLDGDGAKDVAVASGGVLLLFYQRAGRLTEGRPLAAGGHAQFLDAADLDGDGDADLVASMRGSEPNSGVMWYRNTPTGFDRRKLADGFPRDVAIGDVDGDGDRDVVAAHDSYLQILRQAADHTFAEERVPGATHEVEVGDVTGDGRTDIVALSDRTVTVRAQTAAGGVGTAQVLDDNPTRSVGLDLGDIDGDGRTDATAIHAGGFWAEIYLQQPGGGLGEGEGRQVPQGNTGANGLAIGDANADGAPDISYANNNYGLVVRRARSATFPLPAWVRGSTPDEGARGVSGGVVPQLQLSRAVAPASVTPATVWLERSGALVNAVPSYSAGALSVQPAAALAAGDYALRVSGVRDTRGNRLEHTLRFTVGPGGDAAAPDTVLRSAPSGSVKSQSPRMWAYATEQGATLQCSLDNAPFAACPDPIEHSSVFPGAHTFRVRAVDGAGRVDTTPATRSWSGDGQLAAPANDTRDAMTVLAGSSGSVTANTAAATRDDACGPIARDSPGAQSIWYSWTAPADGWATFDATGSSIDTLLGVFAGGCREEHRLAESDDAPGRVTSRVRLWVRSGTQYAIAVDGYSPEGVNAQNGPVRLEWSFQLEADATPPETTIASGPGPVSWTPNVGWTFRASEPGSTFECQFNTSTEWQPCPTPYRLTVFESTHTLRVRAVDPAGNADPTPASRTWRTDAVPPDTRIDAGPPGIVSVAQATLVFHADEPAAFECRLDGGDWSDCVSPASYSGLDEGIHRFEVRAIDDVGNVDPAPAVQAWVIDGDGGDLRAPQTFITAFPPDVTTSTSARFEFTSDEPQGGRFECRLDDGDWLPCASPHVYDGLALGEHSVMVRAIDAAGNVDFEPPEHVWLILPKPGPVFGEDDPSRPSPSAPAVVPQLGLDLRTPSSLRAALRRGLRVRATCNTACELDLRLTVTKAAKRRLGLRSTLLARATGELAGAGETTVTLRFAKRVRRALKDTRRLRASLVLRGAGASPVVRQLRF